MTYQVGGMSDSGLHLYLLQQPRYPGEYHNSLLISLGPFGQGNTYHDLHDLAERLLNIITIYKFQDEILGIERQLV